MDPKTSEQMTVTWRELGLSQSTIDALLKTGPPDDLTRLADAVEERNRLQQELHEYRERERQIAELIGARSTDKLLHDLRNVLNELTLLRAVVESE